MRHAFEAVKTGFEAVIASEFIKSFVEAGTRAEQSANRLTAAFRLQGDQVGFTRNELDDMAESLAHATQFDDKDFKRGEAELLKFGNIYGDVFGRAMKLSADLAAFNGTNVASATQALGKALANPTQGVKGLGAEVGKFLPAQTDMIKNLVESGRGLDAQNLILDVVQKKIGGTADLMNTGYTKAIGDATKSWDKFKESLAGVTVLKGLVVSTLEGIATTLALFSGVAQNSAEPLFGKRLAMYKEMINLQEQIAQAEKAGGHSDLTWTSDTGQVMGEDLRADELKKKLVAMRKEYDAMFILPPEKKQPDPKLGGSPEQIAFLDELKKKTDSIGEGPIAALYAQATKLHLTNEGKPGAIGGELTQTTKDIQKYGQELQEVTDELERGKKAKEDWNTSFSFTNSQSQAISDLQLQTANLTRYREEAELATETQRLTNDINRTAITLEEDKRAAFVNSANALKDDYLKAFVANQDAQRRWTTGFSQAMNEVLDRSTNAAAQINGLFTNAFKGMEDALVGFVKTGKLDFKSLADSIITDIIRIRIQQSIMAPLSTALGGSAGTSAVSGLLNFFGIGYGQGGSANMGAMSYGASASNWVPQAKAAGGPIDAGMPYWVGEQGPELVVPRSSGTVIPNGKAGGSVGVHIENLDMRGASTEAVARLEAFVQSMNGSIENRAVVAVASARQRGVAGLR